VDLSPATARKIGLTPQKGVTKVVVAPIVVPLPNGTLKVGTAAHEPADKPDTVPPHDSPAHVQLASAASGGTRHEK
jgi:rare lipoprotein A (peptidoglycan hydrolase)